MRRVILKRNKGWFGRMRALKLYVDDIEIGSIKAGETITLDIPDGVTELYGKMDWGKTNKFPLAFIEDGDEVFANARFTLNPLRNMAIIQMPITLQSQP